ncbi:MAG: histidine--tRNA ligase [Gammaproteobacteria bacterium RBG_16_57_12]|nr:MAG: histidine--tRNA ligase [Gammaproteobacteria bacterium RBG_16_57_12]
MQKNIQAIRGMNDILPESTPLWRYLEGVLQTVAASYGYQEIRMPLLESTELFKRSIGEVTDIVEKEMYTFADRNGDSLTLRPEGTAGCVRATIESGLLHNQSQRLWYQGPMFRHERPQRGRYRQFHQFGVEAFGLAGPDIDAELILMSARMLERLGLKDNAVLHLNSLGTVESRQIYREKLIHYFEQHQAQLDEDSRNRLYRNPMRILDSKNPQLRDLISRAPKMGDYLDEDSRRHLVGLLAMLDDARIPYQLDPCLVRGLDYYSKTVFEWVTDQLGAQGTLCAGGRFDTLVEHLGGKPTGAAGFAIGMERMVELLRDRRVHDVQVAPQCYLAMMGEAAQRYGIQLAETLRSRLPQLRVLMNCGDAGFKAQLKRADKSGAAIALLIGDDEVRQNRVTVKYLREERTQEQLLLEQLIERLATFVN